MAKITGPLHSLRASGTIAQVLTLLDTRRGAVAKKTHTIRRAPSPAQLARRAAYAAAATAWHDLPPEAYLQYKAMGDLAGITAFNAYMREALDTWASAAVTVWDGGATVWDGGATAWD